MFSSWRSLITGPKSCSSSGPTFCASVSSDKTRAELVVDGVEHDQARTGGAALARIREGRQRRGLGGLVHVRVVADDERILPAELEADLGQALAGDARDHPADCGRAGEADDGDTRIFHERLPCLVAVAVDDVEDARRQPRLGREPREGDRGLGRVLGGLQHRRVPAEQRREDLPRNVRDRRVRGDDQAGDAERLADRHRLAVRRRARHRLAVEAATLSGDEVAELDRAVRLALRVLRRLARLGGDERGDVLPVALEQLGDAAQDGAALGDVARGPVRLRPLGGRDRRVDVLLARAGGEAQHLAGCGGELLERLATGRGSLLAGDDVADGRRACWRGHGHAVNPPSTRSSCPVT